MHCISASRFQPRYQLQLRCKLTPSMKHGLQVASNTLHLHLYGLALAGFHVRLAETHRSYLANSGFSNALTKLGLHG